MRAMLQSISVCAAVVILCVVVTPSANAAVPGEMTVQGRVTDAAGEPLPAGEKVLGFAIYDSETDGILLWGESQTLTTGADGLWTARIGMVTPITPAVLNGSVRWLETYVEVDPDPPVYLPRVPLVSNAYALRVGTIDGATGGVVSGSVITGQGHTVTGAEVFVAGNGNTVDGDQTTVAGGTGNSASGLTAFIGGGRDNIANGEGAVIVGGQENTAGTEGAVIGGRNNNAGVIGFIGGGLGNDAMGSHAAVVSGHGNDASALGAFVGGGFWNKARGDYSVVCGGGRYEPRDSNLALGPISFVGGGSLNFATGDHAAIVGGEENLASGGWSSIPGGANNMATGPVSSVLGGQYNIASDTGSVAAGSFAICSHPRSFVWGDGRSDLEETNSDSPNQFVIGASNGLCLRDQAGQSKTIRLGDHYRDNGIVAWGKVRSDGWMFSYEFGVDSVIHNSTGSYTITLDIMASSANTIIVTATPEIDTAPTSAATMRICSVNQTASNTFDVYINTGAGVAVNNDFMFIATAR